MTDKRQKATKVKCKREESLTNILYLWNIVFSRRSIWVLLSSLADEHNTSPKSTRRHAKLDKFIFGSPWLLDSLCKHWFASAVWNFCRWVADVPPRETPPAAKSEEKRMFSQAIMKVTNLSPNIHINILQTDLHTFPYRINWENLIKDQSIFPLVIILLILITCSLDCVWILLGQNWCWSDLGLKVLKAINSRRHLPFKP